MCQLINGANLPQPLLNKSLIRLMCKTEINNVVESNTSVNYIYQILLNSKANSKRNKTSLILIILYSIGISK